VDGFLDFRTAAMRMMRRPISYLEEHVCAARLSTSRNGGCTYGENVAG
jgi:hypothetical protein